MSSWPGVRGSTVSTSNVGDGLVVDGGGEVVAGTVVLVGTMVVVVAVETGKVVVVAGSIVEVTAVVVTRVSEDAAGGVVGSETVRSVVTLGITPSSGSATDVPHANKQHTDTTIATARRGFLIRS